MYAIVYTYAIWCFPAGQELVCRRAASRLTRDGLMAPATTWVLPLLAVPVFCCWPPAGAGSTTQSSLRPSVPPQLHLLPRQPRPAPVVSAVRPTAQATVARPPGHLLR
eukprot:SAG11_NODE_897_length_6637_cov_8.510320_4_plen_108_part_00